MTLVLDIEHLLGVAFASRDQSSDAPDWPPQPDRVFSALVAAWGNRGERDGERRALEWLEAQQAPEIVASGGHPRTAPIVFVPPNDPEGGRVGNEAVMPTLRRRQARRFPALRPDDPVVSLVWHEAEPDPDTLAALNVLAAGTAYVGHSASLTRCWFRAEDAPPNPAAAARRHVYAGRLAELERDFRADPPRRPRPGVPLRAAPDRSKDVLSGVFATEWLVLEHVEGEMPDIRAAALLAKELRNAVMSGYREIGLGEAIPAAVSGHSPDGQPSREPHLAIAPLAFVGAPYASGAVLGFALIPPRDTGLLADSSFRAALHAVMPLRKRDDPAERRRQMVFEARFAGWEKQTGKRLRLLFEIRGDSGRSSLDSAPYVGKARIWASCTPLVLDRHLKGSGNAARQLEIDGLIRRACVNIGLPEPSRISAGKHSAVEGAPSAYPSGGEPHWTRWRLPESLASRPLIHAIIEFPVAVRGPVLLGAGRFVGLGLCRRLDPRQRP